MTKEELIEKLRDIVDKFEDITWSTEIGSSSLKEDWIKIGDIEDELKQLLCIASGGHTFEYDQCCYWQHKFCVLCFLSQYPDLARKSCSVLSAEMGKMTEEEYIEKQKHGN